MNVENRVLDSKVNLSNPSAHLVKCVNNLWNIYLADFSNLKFILMSFVNNNQNSSIRARPSLNPEITKWTISYPGRTEPNLWIGNFLFLVALFGCFNSLRECGFNHPFLKIKPILCDRTRLHATRNRGSRHRGGVYVVMWPLLLRIKIKLQHWKKT